MTFIYFDTNVLRYFGQAFQSAKLEPSLRSRIALSPLSVAEILAQVKFEDAYNEIQAIWNWLEPTNAQFLDWPEVFIREHVFGIQTPEGAAPPKVFRKLEECLQSSSDLPSFRIAAEGITRCWKDVERRSAEARRDNVEFLRSHPDEDPTELMRKFSLNHLRSLAGVHDQSIVADDKILEKLNAFITLDLAMVSNALNEPQFEFFSEKRMNDQVDIEQLVYLADDRARYVSGDKNAYKRLKGTPQWPRIRIEVPSGLMNAATATATLKQMLE